jgi:UDP-glucose 4-epimerase
MNVLITGISGCIGSNLAYELHKQKNNILGIDRRIDFDSKIIQKLNTSESSRFLELDLAIDSTIISEVMENFSPDIIFHFASEKSISKSLGSPLSFWSNNLYSTINILKSLKDKKIKGIIFSSSAAVYGESKISIKENDTIEPISIYGKTKLANEMLLEDFYKTSGTNIIILRYFNVLGSNPNAGIFEDRQNDSKSIAGYLLNSLEDSQDEFKINGKDLVTADGTPERDYVHLKDVTDANIKTMNAILDNKIHFDSINIGTGIKTTVLEMVSYFEKISKQKIPIKFVDMPSNELFSSSADISKAKKLLNWSPSHDIQDIVRDCLEDTKD